MTTLDEAWEMDSRTLNGMKAYGTALSACVDFFFLAGASRGKDISIPFIKAYNENPEYAIRTLLWMRDIRGGAGERKQFRDLAQTLLSESIEDTQKILKMIPEVGRWDDLLIFANTALENQAFSMIADALKSENGLCAKWMPRKGKLAASLRSHLGMTPKQYRKTLVHLTEVVETKMCAGDWGDIEYGKVPSVAAARYQKAFDTHDPVGYKAYREGLESGEEKINAGAVYPHDVIKSCLNGNDKVAQAQWDALPDFMAESDENILPVVDVSGSMFGLPIDVAVSLGLYISERNKGAYKDIVCTFSANPDLVKLKTIKLKDRIREVRGMDWGFNTDLNKVFTELLGRGVKYDVPNEAMPTMILIMSDMEFDTCVDHDDRAIEMIERKYAEHGYTMPKVVFWNLNGRVGNVPVRQHKDGTALVSGFSPSILKSILGDMSKFTPKSIMLETIMNDRYDYNSL